MSISVTNLSKNYGPQKAVNDISFVVNKGEIVGFLGPNGAGKSTTMKMITGYLASDTGRVNVCGISSEGNTLEIKKKIGYLPEANPLYMDMYVREYLTFVANVHKIKDEKPHIEAVIKTVGLSPEANKKIGQLSKGYKQRVGLAAALVHNPEVLILDEPTSGLDPNQIIEIREVIKKLGQSKTILFSSHIMQEVEAICNRVIIIHKGNIVADDTLANLQTTNEVQQSILVEFKENVNIEIIKKIPGVSEIKQIESSVFDIKCSNAEAVKKEIFKLSIEENLNIVTIQTQVNTLETVFKLLTT
ncbi:MAG: gliding motility-associated ABC transporter ATP-binding subunit GldA [Ferruginibacter sp.]